MRRDAIVDVDRLFDRFVVEVLHPAGYPAEYCSTMVDNNRHVGELTNKGVRLFWGWLKEQGIMFVEGVTHGKPKTVDLPIEQLEPDSGHSSNG